MGTGIPRALHAWPKIELIDDREGNQFKAVVWRPQGKSVKKQVTPEVTPEVTEEVLKMLAVLGGKMTRGEIMEKLGLKDEKHFRERYQQAGVLQGMIEMTVPGKPNSSKQRYRLTAKGKMRA